MYCKVFYLFQTARFFSLVFCTKAFASEAASPWREVGLQFLNFSVFAGILWFIVLKKLPPVFKQNQLDFLTYRKQARDLQQKHEGEAHKWQKDMERVEAKQRGLNQEVQQALGQLRLQLEGQLLQDQKILKGRKQSELARKRLILFHRLKEDLLKQIMEQSRSHLKQNPSSLDAFLKDIVKQEAKTG